MQQHNKIYMILAISIPEQHHQVTIWICPTWTLFWWTLMWPAPPSSRNSPLKNACSWQRKASDSGAAYRDIWHAIAPKTRTPTALTFALTTLATHLLLPCHQIWIHLLPWNSHMCNKSVPLRKPWRKMNKVLTLIPTTWVRVCGLPELNSCKITSNCSHYIQYSEELNDNIFDFEYVA